MIGVGSYLKRFEGRHVGSRCQNETIQLDDGQTVSGLLQAPPKPLACLALAHGAGAGMRHPLLSAARRLVPKISLFAGGKSFGGRMTSQAQAESPLPDVRGLVFLGFPLLFLQGTRDDFATLPLLRPLVQQLGARATLELIDDADHSLRVPKRAGRSNEEVFAGVLDTLTAWIESVRVRAGP